MKLVIVTAVEQFHGEVVKLFKTAGIENFSESEIDGHQTNNVLLMASNWFGSKLIGSESTMFFSFTEEVHIDKLFELIKTFNAHLETNNPIKGVIIPIEKSI